MTSKKPPSRRPSRPTGTRLSSTQRIPGQHLNLGRLFHVTGDVASAEAGYRQAVAVALCGMAIAPGSTWLVALEDRGSADEALAGYDRALALDPDLADAHHNSAWLCERLGRPSEALRRLSAAGAS